MTREEAIEIIKRNCTSGSDLRKACELFIPELAESEDEKFRKYILKVCKECVEANDEGLELSMSTTKKLLAYLEKQKEQKPVEFLSKRKVYDIMNKLTELSTSELIPFESEEYVKIHEITSDVNSLLDYPIEQKPAECIPDSVKFEEGFKTGRELGFREGVESVKPAEWSEDNIKELTEFEAAMLHIGMSFFGGSAGLNPNNTNEVKKQAKLLLELVPKQEWSKEDERIINDAIYDLEYVGGYPNTVKRLKSLRPQAKQEWSEEDEKILNELLDYCNTENATWYNWLKSLRPQPKEQKPVKYLDKDKIYAIMKKLHDLSFSQDILINSKEYKQINEITHDVRSLLDYPIEPKPAEWSNLDKDILNDAITAVDLLGNDESFNKSNPNLANAFRVAKDWLETLPERFNVKEEKQEWTKEDEDMLLKLLMMIDTANDYEEIRVWLCTKLNVVTSTELDRKLESDMTQLERYISTQLERCISEARTKKGFYWNNKEVSWEEIPLEERKHDYPYYFKNGLDCYPFRCLDDEGICIKID